ncbi:MAG: DNA-directed RNA polymerase subunit B, partial [Methanopyri archaeon]|nr:DNA-directed RNA polymerase subunit B [Methanopyri archaeon]
GEVKLTEEHLEKLRKGEITWKELEEEGVIEFLDAEEEDNALIAPSLEEFYSLPEEERKKYTHVELDPAAIFGTCCSIIPWPETNSAPRNTMGTNMSRQALGFYAANHPLRTDTRGHLLHYPQEPIVETRGIEAFDYNERPAGQNFVVAVLTYEGYNMEDAIIMNESAIERGLARSFFFKTFEDEARMYPGGMKDKFGIPEPGVRGYRSEEAYKHLGEDGIAEVGERVEGRDVIIGKTSPPRFLEEFRPEELPAEERREASTAIRHTDSGVVDAVFITETSDGHTLVKVRIRDERVPELGDKFSSRHGQKGVIGMIVPEEDMPFTEDGITPDLILNPHALPSRETMGHIFEMLAGKAGALLGEKIDATAFTSDPKKAYEELKKALKELGFEPTGKEVMYDGRTGQKLEAEVFVGVCLYRKLYHMVKDKYHARSRGPVQVLTRQPTEGRAREGGLRFGEMERDDLVAWGASLFLKERLLDESDLYEAFVCPNCGELCYVHAATGRTICPVCGEVRAEEAETSYAFKILLDELKAFCMDARLEVAPLRSRYREEDEG